MSNSKIPRFQAATPQPKSKPVKSPPKANVKAVKTTPSTTTKSNASKSVKSKKSDVGVKLPLIPTDTMSVMEFDELSLHQPTVKDVQFTNQIASLVKSSLQMDNALDEDGNNSDAHEFSIDIHKMIQQEIHKQPPPPISFEAEIENELLYEYEPSEDSLLYAQLNKKPVDVVNHHSLALAFTLQFLDLNEEFVNRKRVTLHISLSLPLDKGRKTYSMKKSVLLKSKIDLNIERRFPLDPNLDVNTWFEQLLEVVIDLPNEWSCKGTIPLSKFKKKLEFQKKIPMWSMRKYGKQDNVFIADLFLNSQLLNYDDDEEDHEDLKIENEPAEIPVQDVASEDSFLNVRGTDAADSDVIPLVNNPTFHNSALNALSIYIVTYHPLTEMSGLLFCCLKLLPLGQPIQTLVQAFPYHFNFEINLPFLPSTPCVIEVWEQGSPNIFIGLCKLSFDMHNKQVELMFPSTNLSIINPINAAYMGSLQVAFGYGNSNKLQQEITTLHRQSLQDIQENNLVNEFIDAVPNQQHIHTSMPQLGQLSQLHQSWAFLANNEKSGTVETPKRVQSIKKLNNKDEATTTNKPTAKSTAAGSSIPHINKTSSAAVNTSINNIKSETNDHVAPIIHHTTATGALQLQLLKIYPLNAFQDRHINDFESQSSNKTIMQQSSFYITFNWYPDGKTTNKRNKQIVNFTEEHANCIQFNKTLDLQVLLDKQSLMNFKHRKQTLKLWRRNVRGDFLIAFTIIDLHYLFDGLDVLEQWYDLVDSNGVILGQILVHLEIDNSILQATSGTAIFGVNEEEEDELVMNRYNKSPTASITQHDLESIYSESNFDQMQAYLRKLNSSIH